MCLRYCQYEQLNDVRRKFDENYEQQEQLRQLYDPSLLIDTLAIAASKAELEAERQAESFLEGELQLLPRTVLSTCYQWLHRLRNCIRMCRYV